MTSSSTSAHAVGSLRRMMPWCADLLGLVALDPRRYPALLESAVTGSPLAEFDIVPAFPGDSLELDGSGVLHGPRAGPGGFLAAFDDWFQSSNEEPCPRDLPFTGGWFVFLGYELAGHIEPTVPVIPDPGGFPRALALRCPAAVIRDHARRCVWLVAEPGHESLVEEMDRDLRAAAVLQATTGAVCGPAVEDPPEQFTDGVARILDYIREGDVFQVNLSRQWRAPLTGNATAVEVYARLRAANPAPFAGIACLGDRWILSSSPERLFKVREGVVNTRPIAGTHPRGENPADDAALSRALIAHPKERAEHIMLIDLERNDLGRVCVAGTVEVNELMVLETYSHVHHIVSNVRGRLRRGTTPGEVIRATFPGGTITGCPKVRCMQIIAELEEVGRGPYTGSFGYLNTDGSGDLNILIRTLGVAEGEISLRAGGGIVADSRPQRELEETRHKARGPLRALGARP